MRSWKASFWRQARRSAADEEGESKASTTKTNATAIQIVRCAAPTLASSELGEIVTSATPSGRPRAAEERGPDDDLASRALRAAGAGGDVGQRDPRASAAKHLLDLVGRPGGRAAAVRRRNQVLLARPDGDAGDVRARADGGAEPSPRRPRRP